MKKCLFFILVVTTQWLCAQKQVMQKGGQQYEKMAYFDVVKTYERLVNKGFEDQELFQKLGDAYYFNADYLKALTYYEKFHEKFKTNLTKENYFRYALCLKTANQLVKSEKILSEMKALFPEDSRPNKRMNIENAVSFKIKNLNINSAYSDFGGQAFGNQFIFYSNRPQNKLFERKHSWTNEAFIKIYSGKLEEPAQISDSKLISFDSKFSFNESNACLSKDGQTMYFTRNIKRNDSKDQSTNYLKIYQAVNKEGRWTDVKELSFNAENCNTAHPTLSADENILYFASDRAGGFGDSDIYYVKKDAFGQFGEAVNLGSVINTEGKENFPFISAENLLYFASNGHAGYGGLDVFVAHLNHQEEIKVQNLGPTLNGPFDDFSFNINNKNGYYSSNKPTDFKGKDDIYAFTMQGDFVWKNTKQNIFIRDIETKLPIIGADLKFISSKLEVLRQGKTNQDGDFIFEGLSDNDKIIGQVTHPDYDVFTFDVQPDLNEMTILLSKKKKQLATGDDLAKLFAFKNIFFDLNKWFIRDDALIDMHKILDILEEFPEIDLEIRSHTDCRNTKAYNLDLSNKRALATKNWLIENGIRHTRLHAKGFGEEDLVNDCACEPKNDSKCSEAEHQANRRSEFIVVKK